MTSLSRISRDEYFLRGAEWASQMGTCYRRKVGCILVNKYGRVIGTGYNGPESGAPHCIDVYCKGALMPSGTGLDLCEAIHAEQNALLQCPDVMTIVSCYVTHSPCIHCVKMLLGTSCKRIVFRNRYAHDEAASLKWLKKNNNVPNVQREWLHIQGIP